MNNATSYILATSAIAFFSLAIVFTMSARRAHGQGWSRWDAISVIAAIMAIVCLSLMVLSILELANLIPLR